MIMIRKGVKKQHKPQRDRLVSFGHKTFMMKHLCWSTIFAKKKDDRKW
jgi:hypothetical protein